MAPTSMVLPLFEKNKHDSAPTEALLSRSDTFDDDIELSLSRKGSLRKTLGTTAGRIFTKAKAGVDALRVNRLHQLWVLPGVCWRDYS